MTHWAMGSTGESRGAWGHYITSTGAIVLEGVAGTDAIANGHLITLGGMFIVG